MGPAFSEIYPFACASSTKREHAVAGDARVLLPSHVLAPRSERILARRLVAHPPLDGTKAGETIVRTEADVADENVEA